MVEDAILSIAVVASVSALLVMIGERILALHAAGKKKLSLRIGQQIIEVDRDFKPEDLARIKQALAALDFVENSGAGRG